MIPGVHVLLTYVAVIVILALCPGCNVNPENPALYQNIVGPLNDVPPHIPLRL